MPTIKISYEGQLRTQAVHVQSETQLITDAPTDNQGKGESFSPTDLVATGLGSCMLTIMGIVAERHGWDLSRASLSVNKVMASEPVRRIARLEVEIRLPGEFDARARTALEKAALSCPVHATLGASVEMPVAFHWDE
ncbi:MAG: putative redox protein [Planctomycetota bacterium]|jgi:putative redox protein